MIIPQVKKIKSSQNENQALVILPISEKELQKDVKAKFPILVWIAKSHISSTNKNLPSSAL